MEEISALEAAKLLKDSPEKNVLLDVREDMEIKMASVAGALHIPMGQIPDRLTEIDQSKTIIVMCHSGGRSAQVASYLDSLDYRTCNLTGGITAWSDDVDTSVAQY